MEPDTALRKAAQILADARRIVAFTGAGISTESGIPDFRSDSGIWNKYDPNDFLFQKFIAFHKNRKLYWERSKEFYEPILKAQPNAGHKALVRLEQMEKLDCVVTQNIDGLHQRAGHGEGRVIELHGTVATASCLKCGKQWPAADIRKRIVEEAPGVSDGVPYCSEPDPDGPEGMCGGPIKTDTISFGQSMPEKETAEAFARARNADCCLVVGSSLVVQPACFIPVEAKDRGASLIIVNREPTPMDAMADVVIHGSAGESLNRMLDYVLS
ncbi:MAG: Sir2 family NAD-dependent protein deacetylase [Chrysiogenetes bacterium]|nr:Sir2 family NAD-dependent protein deacetylase [Chrysiogenetes bacterium]